MFYLGLSCYTCAHTLKETERKSRHIIEALEKANILIPWKMATNAFDAISYRSVQSQESRMAHEWESTQSTCNADFQVDECVMNCCFTVDWIIDFSTSNTRMSMNHCQRVLTSMKNVWHFINKVPINPYTYVFVWCVLQIDCCSGQLHDTQNLYNVFVALYTAQTSRICFNSTRIEHPLFARLKWCV